MSLIRTLRVVIVIVVVAFALLATAQVFASGKLRKMVEPVIQQYDVQIDPLYMAD